MQHDTSQCSWSKSPNYNISEQTATFQLDSSFGHITQLFVFFSNLSTIDMNQTFIYKGILTLNSGSFTLPLSVGVLYTLSTINGTKNAYEAPPSMPFPLPYQDDFNTYPISSEAAYFVDQTGAWEIIDTFSTHNKVMRQMATELPITWCKEAPYPYSVIGGAHWQQPLNVSVDVMIENVGTPAIVFSINTTNNGLWQFSTNTNLANPLSSGSTSVMSGTWYTIMLSVLSDHSEAYINGHFVGRCALDVSYSRGWVAIGSSWNYVQFDNFYIQPLKE